MSDFVEWLKDNYARIILCFFVGFSLRWGLKDYQFWVSIVAFTILLCLYEENIERKLKRKKSD